MRRRFAPSFVILGPHRLDTSNRGGKPLVSFCSRRVADDLFGFRIEWPDLARRCAERFVYHARAQQVEAGGYPLGLLEDEAIEIAAADEGLGRGAPLTGQPPPSP